MSYIKLYSLDENSFKTELFSKTRYINYTDIDPKKIPSEFSCVPYIFSINKDRSVTIKTQNLYNYINSKNEIDLFDLNPIATRYVGNLKYIERPPFKANILYKDKNESLKTSFSIWIPWTILVSEFTKGSESCNIYFSSKPLSCEEDMYISSVYPNIFDDSRMCFGADFTSYLDKVNASTTSSCLYSYINYFFSGIWNNDISPIAPSFIRDAINIGFINKSQLSELYPTINKYITADDIFISSRLKDLNSSELYDNYDYIKEEHLDTTEDYVYYLFFLSLLDLEETLIFFDELIEFTNLVYQKDSHYKIDYRPSLSSFKNIIHSYELLYLDNDQDDDYFLYSKNINTFQNIFNISPNSSAYQILKPENKYMITSGMSMYFVVLQDSQTIDPYIINELSSFKDSSSPYSTYLSTSVYSNCLTSIINSAEFLKYFHDLYSSQYSDSQEGSYLIFLNFDGTNYHFVKSLTVPQHLLSGYSYNSEGYYNNFFEYLSSSVFSSISPTSSLEEVFDKCLVSISKDFLISSL